MQIGEEVEMTIEDFFNMCEDEGGLYQIDTPDGWKDIDFLVSKKNKESYEISLEDGYYLRCSADHLLLTTEGWKFTKNVNVNSDVVITESGEKRVVTKESIGIHDTYDLSVASPEHRYYSNGIVSHNTGKSLTCEALASYYEMPLLRLDLGAIFAAHVGESEANIRLAIKTAEAVAPTILWLDEIEKGIGGVQSSNQTDGGVTNRVFGTLLTWLQEKENPVFVAATANNVLGIPPEFMRAGRFDEIFFLDLPDADQRFDITEKLFLKKKRDPKNFDIQKIVDASDHYSPVEIEKAINNALFVAFADGKRELNSDDIASELGKFQPLYNSRKEDIENMRTWALGGEGNGGRARLANSTTKKHLPSIPGKKEARKIDLSVDDL